MYVGLEAEEYDRTYKDRALLRRILTYFSPYKRYMLIVFIFLTISSITTSFVPFITSAAINSIEVSTDITYLVFLIVLIFTFNILSFLFNYYSLLFLLISRDNVH